MAVTVTNLIQAPANLWVAVFGTAEPANNSTAPGAGWVDAGGTDGGVTAEVQQGYSYMTVDQIAGPADARLTDMTIKVGTNLAEATLANLRVALNQLTSANTFMEADPTLTGISPNYAAILLRGMRPGGGGPRTVIVRRALSDANVQLAFAKDGKQMVPVSFTGLYVSASIKPFKVDDTP
jgi:hypothetical protein